PTVALPAPLGTPQGPRRSPRASPHRAAAPSRRAGRHASDCTALALLAAQRAETRAGERGANFSCILHRSAPAQNSSIIRERRGVQSKHIGGRTLWHSACSGRFVSVADARER